MKMREPETMVAQRLESDPPPIQPKLDEARDRGRIKIALMGHPTRANDLLRKFA